jgi:hypothetical protein
MGHWHGRWVKFSDYLNLFPGAHHARDGRVVGIYQDGPTNMHDGKKVKYPDYVVVVDGNGDNLMLDIPGSAPQVARIAAVQAQFLEGITSRDDIPEARRALAPPGWQPKAG